MASIITDIASSCSSCFSSSLIISSIGNRAEVYLTIFSSDEKISLTILSLHEAPRRSSTAKFITTPNTTRVWQSLIHMYKSMVQDTRTLWLVSLFKLSDIMCFITCADCSPRKRSRIQFRPVSLSEIQFTGRTPCALIPMETDAWHFSLWIKVAWVAFSKAQASA